MRARAFSLIELLVVIGIISILIGLLMPALKGAREQSRAAVCASNMRQCAAAALQYAHDDPQHRSPYTSFPIFPAQLGVLNPADSWVYTMRPYINPHTVAVCPSDASPHWTEPRPGMPGRLREVSYGINAYVADPSASQSLVPTPARFGGNVDQIKQPVAVIAFAELLETGPIAIGDFALGTAQDLLGQYGYMIGGRHHPTSANYSFWDGHAGALPIEEILDFDSGSDTWLMNKFDPMMAR